MSFSTQILAMASSSWRLYIIPVGLEGLFKIIHLVLGVIAAASFSGVILKCSCSVASTTTGTPPTIRISSI